METVKIKFTDFNSPSFDANRHWVTKTLKKRYRVEISDGPDFLFYSTWGLDFQNYSCVKIFCGGEPISPNFNECDYAFGYEPIRYADRYMQYPVGDSDSPGLYDVDRSIQNRTAITPELFDRKFCNFIYSQDWVGEGAVLRRQFCQAVMDRYKHVDCPGFVLNNMPKGAIAERWTGGSCGNGVVSTGWSDGKLEFLRNYKFTIAFENTSMSGLTTEKLVQPFQANSIPIYWGNPDVAELFNPKAFINCHEYNGDFDSIIARVKELDEDKAKYLSMLRESPLRDNFDFDRVKKAEEFLFRIIERGNRPLAKDATWISSGTRMRDNCRNLENEVKSLREQVNRYGCDPDSNSWKMMRKMQVFADSKWGYLPKKLFKFLLKAWRKLKGHKDK